LGRMSNMILAITMNRSGASAIEQDTEPRKFTFLAAPLLVVVAFFVTGVFLAAVVFFAVAGALLEDTFFVADVYFLMAAGALEVVVRVTFCVDDERALAFDFTTGCLAEAFFADGFVAVVLLVGTVFFGVGVVF
jgi:hypothetical protein